MLHVSKRVQVLVGTAIGVNLLLGAAAAAGVVPRPSGGDAAAAAPVNDTKLASAAGTTEVPATTEAPAADTTVPDTLVPATAPPTTATKATTAPAPVVTEAPAPVSPVPPAAGAPAAPKTAARTNPTSAQVMAAVGLMRQRIPLLPNNEAYARQFGDAVCTAFDQGNDATGVRAMVLQAVSQVPLIKITAADADFAIKTAVQLFCPGYLSKLP